MVFQVMLKQESKSGELRSTVDNGDPPRASCGYRGLPQGSPIGIHLEPGMGTGGIPGLSVGMGDPPTASCGYRACLRASWGQPWT